MADAYSSIVGGKLNLKGGLEKKKKKRLKDSSEAAELVATAAADSEADVAAVVAVLTAAAAACTSSSLRRLILRQLRLKLRHLRVNVIQPILVERKNRHRMHLLNVNRTILLLRLLQCYRLQLLCLMLSLRL
jgi:hypothetical protein